MKIFFSYWDIDFANPPSSVIHEALHEILREEGLEFRRQAASEHWRTTSEAQHTAHTFLHFDTSEWEADAPADGPPDCTDEFDNKLCKNSSTSHRYIACMSLFFEIKLNRPKQKCPRQQCWSQNWCQKSGQDIASKGMSSFQYGTRNKALMGQACQNTPAFPLSPRQCRHCTGRRCTQIATLFSRFFSRDEF